MDRILLVAATVFEIEPLLKELGAPAHLKQGVLCTLIFKGKQVDVLVTGAGMVNTAFYMGGLKGNSYKLAINAGVCGSFNERIVTGDVVNVIEDDFSELGAEDGDEFLPLDAIGLGSASVLNEVLFLHPLSDQLLKVKGITVNTVHGNARSIEIARQRSKPDVESMEGAAFLMACNSFRWDALQLRCVSNKVERRNKKNWNLPLAITNLNSFLVNLLNELP